MMTKTYRLVALVTLSVMLIFTALPALASEGFYDFDASQIGGIVIDEGMGRAAAPWDEAGSAMDPQSRWTNTNACSVNLTIASNGSYEISATCVAKYASYSITIRLELQQKSGSSWSTIRTLYGSGNGVAIVVGNGSVGSGTYRAKATFNVSGEEIILYSREQVHP